MGIFEKIRNWFSGSAEPKASDLSDEISHSNQHELVALLEKDGIDHISAVARYFNRCIPAKDYDEQIPEETASIAIECLRKAPIHLLREAYAAVADDSVLEKGLTNWTSIHGNSETDDLYRKLAHWENGKVQLLIKSLDQYLPDGVLKKKLPTRTSKRTMINAAMDSVPLEYLRQISSDLDQNDIQNEVLIELLAESDIDFRRRFVQQLGEPSFFEKLWRPIPESADKKTLVPALFKVRPSVLRAVLESLADDEFYLKWMETAIVCGNEYEIEWLVKNNKVTPEQKNSCGHTPLMEAAIADSVSAARTLIKLGAKWEDQESWGCLVQLAAVNGSLEFLEFLKDVGITLHTVDEQGQTLLHLAAKNNQSETVAWLINNGVDPSLNDEEGRTALDVARECECEAVVALLEPEKAETDVELEIDSETLTSPSKPKRRKRRKVEVDREPSILSQSFSRKESEALQRYLRKAHEKKKKDELARAKEVDRELRRALQRSPETVLKVLSSSIGLKVFKKLLGKEFEAQIDYYSRLIYQYCKDNPGKVATIIGLMKDFAKPEEKDIWKSVFAGATVPILVQSLLDYRFKFMRNQIRERLTSPWRPLSARQALQKSNVFTSDGKRFYEVVSKFSSTPECLAEFTITDYGARRYAKDLIKLGSKGILDFVERNRLVDVTDVLPPGMKRTG